MDPMEAFLYFSKVVGPFSLIGSVICGFAVITSYIFPFQRRFPTIILVWTCVVDFIIATYDAIKWVDGPMKHILTDTVVPGSLTCRICIYIDTGLEVASSVACVMVAFTLNATIIRNIDFNQFSEIYYRRFVAILWGVPILYPLLTLIELNSETAGIGYCTLASTPGLVLMVLPWVLGALIQIYYIVPVFIYIAKVKRNIRQSVHNSEVVDNGQKWLYIRFLGMITSQLILWFNVIVYNVKNATHQPIARSHTIFVGMAILFLSVNGLIVIFGNKSLKEYLWNLITPISRNTKESHKALSTATTNDSISVKIER